MPRATEPVPGVVLVGDRIGAHAAGSRRPDDLSLVAGSIVRHLRVAAAGPPNLVRLLLYFTALFTFGGRYICPDLLSATRIAEAEFSAALTESV